MKKTKNSIVTTGALLISTLGLTACVSDPVAAPEFLPTEPGWVAIHEPGDTASLEAQWETLSARAYSAAIPLVSGASEFYTEPDRDELAELFAESQGQAAPFGSFQIDESTYLFTRCEAEDCKSFLSAVVTNAEGHPLGAALLELQWWMRISEAEPSRNGWYCHDKAHTFAPDGGTISASAQQALTVWLDANLQSFDCELHRNRLQVEE